MAKYCATIPHMVSEILGKAQLKKVPGKQSPPGLKKSHQDKRSASIEIDKVIHDFRSSLNIIIGNSELMLDDVMGKMNKEQRESLKDILKNSECLLDLVNDISIWQDADFKKK